MKLIFSGVTSLTVPPMDGICIACVSIDPALAGYLGASVPPVGSQRQNRGVWILTSDQKIVKRANGQIASSMRKLTGSEPPMGDREPILGP